MRKVMKTAAIAVILSGLLAAGCSVGSGIPDGTSGAPEVSSPPVADGGFDVAAYFVADKAVKGVPQLKVVWRGATYLFSNEENRKRFAEAPEKYLPQFESHCPVSIANGKRIEGRPTAWRVFKDRLYFFVDESAAEYFDRSPEEVLRSAEKNWKPAAERQD